MNSFQFKIIALISMTLDHLGYFLFPEIEILRIIGRIAFIIFAYLLIIGFTFTKNHEKHILTLFIFSIVTQFLFYLFNIDIINIGFSFLIVYLILYFLNKKEPIYIFISFLFFILPLMFRFDFDYGYYGILLMLGMYLFISILENNYLKINFNLNNFKMKKELFIILLICLNLILIHIYYDGFNTIQIYSTFGIVLLYLYNFEKGKDLRYLFYIYYPTHIIILKLLYDFIN